MPHPEWPAELVMIARTLSPTTIEGRKKPVRMSDGTIALRPTTSPRSGFVGEATMTDIVWRKLLSASGVRIMEMPAGERRQISLMTENTLYPGYAPMTLQQVYEPDREPIRTVRFWFMDHGPVGPTEGDP